MRPIRTGEPASDEFSEAVRWYEARRSGLGGEFFDAVAATLALIETNPEIGASISADGQTRRALVSGQVSVPSRVPTSTHRDGDCGRRPLETTSGILEEPKLIGESAQRFALSRGGTSVQAADGCKERCLRHSRSRSSSHRVDIVRVTMAMFGWFREANTCVFRRS